MSFITRNWGCVDWQKHMYTQTDGNWTIIKGKYFDTKPVQFECDEHVPSKEVYPHKSDLWAVYKNVNYLAFYFYWKAFTAIGNGVVGAGNILYGTYSTVRNISKKEFSKKEAFRPAWNNATQLLKDGAIALAAYSATTENVNLYWTSFSTVIAGYNVTQVGLIATLGLAALHAVHNPKGFQMTARFFQDSMDPTPMTDGEWHQANFFRRGVAILDGRCSFARMLGMHYMGKSDQKGKFQDVKKS